MNYNQLMNLGTSMGRKLMESGAEIYRVEESVSRLLSAYGVQAQVFAIPNCLIRQCHCAGGPTHHPDVPDPGPWDRY